VQSWTAKSGPVLDYDAFNTLRLSAFHQLDIRVDKSYYFHKWSLTIYVDIQNIYNFKADLPDNLIRETDAQGNPIIINPDAAPEDQRYQLKYIESESGTVLPTIGLMFEI